MEKFEFIFQIEILSQISVAKSILVETFSYQAIMLSITSNCLESEGW